MSDKTVSTWPKKPLSEVVDLNPRLDKSAYRDDLEVSFVPMAAVEAGSGRMEVSQTKHFGAVKKGYTPFKEGDVLFAKITPCMENGKVAVVPKLTNGLGFGSTEFHVLRPRAGIDQHYVYHFVSSQHFRREAAHRMTGAVGQKRVPQSFLEEALIPVPLLEDQQRIVAEIEKQFSRLDEAVASLKRIKANLKRYKAAVLKAAVEGKLTDDWRKQHPDVEPASKLLDRILSERRREWKGKGKYREPDVLETTLLPKLPDGWAWTSLGNLLREPLRNGHSAKASGTGHGLRAFTLSAVTEGDFSERNTKLTVAHADKVADLWAQPGDIYVERSNTPELVGLARLYKGPARFAFIPDLLIRVRILAEVSVQFVEVCLLSEHVRRYFRSKAQGISGTMPKIDQSVIEKTPIPLPPVHEQGQIVAEVERRLSVIDELEATVEANLTRADRLRQSVLGSAFSGQLIHPEGN